MQQYFLCWDNNSSNMTYFKTFKTTVHCTDLILTNDRLEFLNNYCCNFRVKSWWVMTINICYESWRLTVNACYDCCYYRSYLGVAHLCHCCYLMPLIFTRLGSPQTLPSPLTNTTTNANAFQYTLISNVKLLSLNICVPVSYILKASDVAVMAILAKKIDGKFGLKMA